METLLITKIKNPKNASVLQTINELFGQVRVLKGKELENYYLSGMMNKAMKSKNVPMEKVRRELRK